MQTLPLSVLLEFAVEAAWQAGRITLGYFQTKLEVERKVDSSPLTIADRLAEQKLRELITTTWPGHGIIGEEYGQTPGPSPYTWIIDPIDGTKSFVSGVPLYSNLVALREGDETVVGVINLPALNETIYAGRGMGCFWNGRRAHVSQENQLEKAVLLFSDANTFTQYGKTDAWDRLVKATYIQRTWGDAYGYGLVATGRAEVMVDPIMEIWDAAPLPVILEEAGGTFTDWRGRRTIQGHEGIATNGVLFPKVIQVINDQ